MTASSDNTNTEYSRNGIDVMVVDIHGSLRGKTVPASARSKVLDGEVRLPVSTLFQDIWGQDNDEVTGLALSIGDPDGVCVVEPGTLQALPWRNGSQQVLASLHTLTGEACFADSRMLLQNVLQRFHARKLQPVVAVELEFYLLDADAYASGIARPPAAVIADAESPGPLHLYDIRSMDRMQDVLQTIHDYAQALNVPADTTLGEFGPGQFEINLVHNNNALQAADEAVLFKRAVECAAHKHDMACTFMAMPYTQHSGSGMHVHVSVLDEQGDNIFANTGSDTTAIADTLLHATSGLLENLCESQVFFAPNGNSYRRLQPGNFAPMQANWSRDHRGVAIRLPETQGAAARLEHRCAGADANPYLVLAAILAGVFEGLENRRVPASGAVQPGDELTGEALAHDWLTAIEHAADSGFVERTFGELFRRVYTDVKRVEAVYFNSRVSNVDLQSYLARL